MNLEFHLKLKVINIILILVIPYFTFSQSNFHPNSDGQEIDHSYYSLSYNEAHEQAEWVYYFLTSSMINGSYQLNSHNKVRNKDT